MRNIKLTGLFLVLCSFYGCNSDTLLFSNNKFHARTLACHINEKGTLQSTHLLILESTYAVSFEGQYVVSKTPYRFSGCEVFDKNNWHCSNKTLPDAPLIVSKGELSPSCEGFRCYIPINLFNLFYIKIGGTKIADKYCNAYNFLLPQRDQAGFYPHKKI